MITRKIKNMLSFLFETKKGEILLVLSLLFVVSLVYSNILSYKYTGEDFFAQVAGNTNLKDALAAPLSQNFLGDNWYRPVDAFTIYLDYTISGLNPFMYQFTNYFIFIFAIFLVYIFVREIFKDKKLAFLSSFIFGLYPLNMYIVPVAEFRAEMLVAVFIILTILFLDRYLDTKDKKWQIFGVISAFLVVGSKEIGFVMMPLLVLFYIILKEKNKQLNLKKLIYTISPYFASVVFYFSLVFIFLGSYGARGMSLAGKSISAMIFDRITAATVFFKSLIYPVDVLGLDNFELTLNGGESIGLSWIFITVITLIFILFFVMHILRLRIKIRQLFNFHYLEKYFTKFSFLLFWIIAYFSFFVFYGKFNSYYAFLVMPPAAVLISTWYFKQEKLFKVNLKKIIVIIFIIYCVIASPIFTSYINYTVSGNAKEILVSEIIDSAAEIPENATIYAVCGFGGVLGEGYSTGIPPYSLKGLLHIKYGEKNWRIIQISQFVVQNANQPYSVNYTLEQLNDTIHIELFGENILFSKYPAVSSHNMPIREDVYVSGDLFPYGNFNQTVIIEKYNISDYLYLCTAEESRAHASIISIKDAMD